MFAHFRYHLRACTALWISMLSALRHAAYPYLTELADIASQLVMVENGALVIHFDSATLTNASAQLRDLLGAVFSPA